MTLTKRPRDVDAIRAGALLYGDLGTSKAYVIGLALAIAGYSSFWLIFAVSLLCILVGINYMVICRCYPSGGGVYSSARRRSEILSLVGAFFIVADYLVTAALSGLSAMNYFNASHPLTWTCVSIACIGLFNYFGPKHTGRYAFYIVILTISALVVLAIFSLPHLKEAFQNLQPLKGSFLHNWKNFVSIIVALSGVEAIANITGVMKLDPHSTLENPKVKHTATKAILWVILEVAIFTSLFSLTSLSLKNITLVHGDVYAGDVSVRDYILRFMGETFVSEIFGFRLGMAFALILGLAIGILLLSAVNTAINGLIAIQYVLSQDRELPQIFQKLNRFGVPVVPLFLGSAIPIVILLVIRDIPGLANLYAIGFVGAIATNLGATSTDWTLDLKKRERILMFFSFLIFIAIEVTLFIDKPHARYYVLTIVLIGLIMRGLAKEWQKEKPKVAEMAEEILPPPPAGEEYAILYIGKDIAAKGLAYAMEVAERRKCPLYLLYVKEQAVISETDLKKNWEEDPDAKTLFSWVQAHTTIQNLYLHYTVSDSRANTVAQYAKQFQVNVLILEMFPHKRLDIVQIRLIREIKNLLPANIQLIVIP